MIESMGPFGGGADQESGSMGVGLAGAWGFSGEPGTGSIWKVGFVGAFLSVLSNEFCHFCILAF